MYGCSVPVKVCLCLVISDLLHYPQSLTLTSQRAIDDDLAKDIFIHRRVSISYNTQPDFSYMCMHGVYIVAKSHLPLFIENFNTY